MYIYTARGPGVVPLKKTGIDKDIKIFAPPSPPPFGRGGERISTRGLWFHTQQVLHHPSKRTGVAGRDGGGPALRSESVFPIDFCITQL